jgi:hypothetical protein
MLGMVTDLARSKPELVAENALLRQQLMILSRQVKRPAFTKADRFLLVFWQELLERGSKPFHHPGRRRSSVGIDRDFACVGKTNLRLFPLNQMSPKRSWP